MKTIKVLKAVALIDCILICIAYSFLPARSSANNGFPSTSQIKALFAKTGQIREKGIHPTAGVHGTVVVQTRPAARRGKNWPKLILMPGIELYLHNMVTNKDSSPERSDMMGRFRFPKVENGRYELRWNAQKGWAAGTFPDPVIVSGHIFYAESATLQPEKGKFVLTGNVKLADGTSPWFYSEEHGVVKAATITSMDTGTNKALSEPVLANFAGQFAIAGLDRRAKLKLTVATEGSRMEKKLSPSLLTDGGASTPVNITLKNHRPRILDMIAMVNGKSIRVADPGTTLQVKANIADLDRDRLELKWSTDNGTVYGSEATVDWHLPKQPGNYTITLLVTDSMGGAVSRQFGITVGKQTAIFTGKVVDPNGRPIYGADVNVNGVNTKSDKDGQFKVSLDIVEQYVLNIRKPGFALLSRLLDRPTNQRWQLVDAQVESVDADKDIRIVDRRPGIVEKKMSGSLQLKAGSLVDPSGNRASGTLTAELATLDITNDELPGDLLANASGRDVALISYGAMWVEFTNASGQKLQLAPGASARVTIPVPGSMRRAAPRTMTVWSYDDKDGRWKTSGTAGYKREQNAYVGTVTHLSTINMDQPGSVSCICVHTDVGLPAELTLRVRDVPGQGVDFAQVKSMVLAGEESSADGPLNAVWRVPANSDVQFEILNDTGVLVSGSPNPMVVVEDGDTRGVIGTPLPDNRVTAGPDNPDLWPISPFTSCTDVTLKLFPRWGSYPSSSFLIIKAPLPGPEGGAASAATANAYYDAIDPLPGTRRTLADWYSQNGFDSNGDPPVGSNPAEYARTSYLNNNDLGSGRDMNFHIDPVNGTLSAYVTNYSREVAFDQRAVFADDAATDTNPGATVCMEYSPVPGDTSTTPARKIVKFFVYFDAANDGTAEIQPAANLDGFGLRFVPGLCVNCHGFGPPNGGYFDPIPATINDVDIGANFRELDLATYHFPGNSVIPSVAEQAAFRAQNLMIHQVASIPIPTLTCPTGPCPVQNPVTRGPITEMINKWYHLDTVPVTDQDNSFTPANWGTVGSASHGLYHDVVKVSCRTCHIAFDSTDDLNGRDWNRYDQMSSRPFIRDFAIGPNWTTGSGRLMPHALVTYRNFWLQTSVAPNPQGSRAQRLWEYSDGAVWPAYGPPVLP